VERKESNGFGQFNTFLSFIIFCILSWVSGSIVSTFQMVKYLYSIYS
jgi:hypothetical protein